MAEQYPGTGDVQSGSNPKTPGPIRSSIQDVAPYYGKKEGAGSQTEEKKTGVMAPKGMKK